MTGKGGTGQACAACKYQRRKCSPECPLAPYFPPDQPKQFLNVHKLFGVSNILRILRQVNESQKSDAMKSIIYQANAREKDPVHGCFGIIILLHAQVERMKEELEIVRSQIMVMEQQNQRGGVGGACNGNGNVNVNGNGNVNGMLQHMPLSYQHAAPMPASPAAWVYPNVDGQPFYAQTNHDFIRPNNRFLEYEERQQPYGESKEAYESSVESSLKEMQCMDHVADHELKSAAALFTLTNHY